MSRFTVLILLCLLQNASLAYAKAESQAAINKKPDEVIELAFYRFEVNPSYYDSYISYYWPDHIRFYYRFHNKSDDLVTGIQFKLTIRDAVGKELYSKKINLGVQIFGRGKSSENEYFYWENNQFEKNDAYDRLLPCVQANNCKVECEVTGVSFQKGRTIQNE